MKSKITLVMASAIILSSCASITRGTSEAFVIESTPTGASASLSNGLSCTTPCSLKMKRKSEFVVTLHKEGYRSVQANVTNQVAGGGAAGMAGNVLLGGLIGAAVDAGSGAMLELVPNPLKVTMEPLAPGDVNEPIVMEAPKAPDSVADEDTADGDTSAE